MSVRVPVGRMAPTPSGHLHLGNALAFGAAWLSVRNQNGRLLLRMEDLDRGRAREEVAQGQRDDLRWLGLDWDSETPPQSTRTYSLAGIPTYRCVCSRKNRLMGLCRCREAAFSTGAWRFAGAAEAVAFDDRTHGPQSFVADEDPILMRPDGEAAYPLAVVQDDYRDGVTEVVRGSDLLPATALQVQLAQLLAIPVPTYLHVPLLVGPDGRKLSKSHGSTEIRALRAAGMSAADVWRRLLPLLGLSADHVHGAVASFDPTRISTGVWRVRDDGWVDGRVDPPK